jgi:hypothetical protein
MSRGELQADVYNRSGVCKPHQKEKPRRQRAGLLSADQAARAVFADKHGREGEGACLDRTR